MLSWSALRQVDQLRQFLTGQLPLLLVDLAFVGLFLAVLLAVAPPLGLVTLAAMPVFALLSLGAQRRQEAHQRASFQAAGAKASALGEAVTQALTVKLLALEPDMKRRYEGHLLRSAWRGLQSGRITHVAGSLARRCSIVTALLLVYLGARMIVAGDMSVGALSRRRSSRRGRWRPCASSPRPGASSGRRRTPSPVLTVCCASPARRAGAWQDRAGAPGRLRVEGVSFTYPGAAAPALDGVSFELEPGTIVGVAGPPGSGKSTLVRLLLGVETPEPGRILLDGQDLARLSPTELPAAARRGAAGGAAVRRHDRREHRDGGRGSHAWRASLAAARFVGADEFVRRLPQGYETVLGERGPACRWGSASSWPSRARSSATRAS